MMTVFQVCFYTGIGLTVISFLVSGVFDIAGFDGLDLDVDFDMDAGAGSLLPLNPLVLLLFITAFGGSGMILLQSFSVSKAVVLLLSAAIGFCISFLIHRFIFLPLKKAQNTSAPGEEELIGILARVHEGISEENCGEIMYSIHGNSYNAPARSIDGSTVSKGTEVTICWIKDYIFYVTAVDKTLQK